MEQTVNGQLVSNQAEVNPQLPVSTGQSSGKHYTLTSEERMLFVEQILQFQGMQRGALTMLARLHGFTNARLSPDFSEMVEVDG